MGQLLPVVDLSMSQSPKDCWRRRRTKEIRVECCQHTIGTCIQHNMTSSLQVLLSKRNRRSKIKLQYTGSSAGQILLLIVLYCCIAMQLCYGKVTILDTQRMVQDTSQRVDLRKNNHINRMHFNKSRRQKGQYNGSIKFAATTDVTQMRVLQYSMNRKQDRRNRMLMGMMNSTKSPKKNSGKGKGKGKGKHDDDNEEVSDIIVDPNEANKSPKGSTNNVDNNETDEIVTVPSQNENQNSNTDNIDANNDSTDNDNNADNNHDTNADNDHHDNDHHDNGNDNNNSFHDTGDNGVVDQNNNSDNNGDDNHGENVDNSGNNVDDNNNHNPSNNSTPANSNVGLPEPQEQTGNNSTDGETNNFDPLITSTLELQSFVVSVAVIDNISKSIGSANIASATDIHIPISEEQLRIGLMLYMSNSMMIYDASIDISSMSLYAASSEDTNDDTNIGRHGIDTLTNFIISKSSSTSSESDIIENNSRHLSPKQDSIDNKVSTSSSFLQLQGTYIGSSIVYSTSPDYNDTYGTGLDSSALVSTIWYRYNYTGNLTLVRQIYQDNNNNNNNNTDYADDDTVTWQMKQRYSLSDISALKLFLNRYLFVYYGSTTSTITMTTAKSDDNQQGRKMQEQDDQFDDRSTSLENAERNVTIITDVSIRFPDGQIFGNANTGIDLNIVNTTDSSNEEQVNGTYSGPYSNGTTTNINIIVSTPKRQYDPVLICVMVFVGCGAFISMSFVLYNSCVQRRQHQQDELTRGSFLAALQTSAPTSFSQHPSPTTISSSITCFDWIPKSQKQQYQEIPFQDSNADDLPLLRKRRSSNDDEVIFYKIVDNGKPQLTSYDFVRRNSMAESSSTSSCQASATIISLSPSGTIIATATTTTDSLSDAKRNCLNNIYCHLNERSDKGNSSCDIDTTCTIFKRNEVIVQPNTYNYSSDECEEFALHHFLPDVSESDDDVDYDNIHNIIKIASSSSICSTGASNESEISRIKLFLAATKALECTTPNQSTINFTRKLLEAKQRQKQLQQQQQQKQHSRCRLSIPFRNNQQQQQQQHREFVFLFRTGPKTTNDQNDDSIGVISYHSPTLETASVCTPTEIEFNGDEFDEYYNDKTNIADEKLKIIGLVDERGLPTGSNSCKSYKRWYLSLFSSSSSSSNNNSTRSIASA